MEQAHLERPCVVIAGASGYVGRALSARLVADYEVIGLSRGGGEEADARGVRWRGCDLYSLLETERALEGADLAVYLVHSMLPSARLTQARFEDLDLILADNFARAAAKAGVRQIVYLGGLVPEGERSRHLESRREVEDALAAHGVPVTSVRAGLVVGPGGSSLEILTALVRRLPLMLTPRWTETLSQPIALDDLLPALEHALGREAYFGQALDVGGPDVLTYREMMTRTARSFGVRRFIFPVPFLTPRLSVAWVCMVTGASPQLVGPLVESLRHPMVARDQRLLAAVGGPKTSFDEAISRAMAEPPTRSRRRAVSPTRTARSVQRLPAPAGKDANWVAEEYARWLPRFFRPFLQVVRAGDRLRFLLRGIPWPLLELTYTTDRSTPDRSVYRVTGGWLARLDDGPTKWGRLEFRLVKDGAAVLAAVHDFRPRLPWLVYSLTQAKIHLLVMHAFGRHLARVSRDSAPRAPGATEVA